MQFGHVQLENFRNFRNFSLPLKGKRHFLLGKNAQGKSNLLEALNWMSALRSFRTLKSSVLIREGADTARLRYNFLHEQLGESELIAEIQTQSKQIKLDGQKLKSWKGFLGKFPSMMLAHNDLQWIRQGAQARRALIDRVLSSLSYPYKTALDAYEKARACRLRLLRDNPTSPPPLLESFETLMATNATSLQTTRWQLSHYLNTQLQHLYTAFEPNASVAFAYQGNPHPSSPKHLRNLYAETRLQDARSARTLWGPHRDDWTCQVAGKALKHYGSDGQQRSFALALALALFTFLRKNTGLEPVLLLDDVLGELDAERQATFWTFLETSTQVIASGTHFEDKSHPWQIHPIPPHPPIPPNSPPNSLPTPAPVPPLRAP